MMKPDATHDLVDLEQALKDDVRGPHRAALVARLTRMREACATARRNLHDKETFRRIEAASAAVDAAITAIDLMRPR